MGWFGIRGVGSVYYLAFALTHGLPARRSSGCAASTLATVAASVVVHGVSVTPLMDLYLRRKRTRHGGDPAAASTGRT